jgi:hypothetical protein
MFIEFIGMNKEHEIAFFSYKVSDFYSIRFSIWFGGGEKVSLVQLHDNKGDFIYFMNKPTINIMRCAKVYKML